MTAKQRAGILNEVRGGAYIQDPKTGRMNGSKPGNGTGSTKAGSPESNSSFAELSTTVGDAGRFESLKAGAASLPRTIVESPALLASYSPESLKATLEAGGYEVKPLGKGRLKGIPFELGGGYRVHFDGNGILQYHPQTKSHHGGAYYKLSTAKGGTKRYGLDGTEQP